MYGQESEIGREVVRILSTYYVLHMELTLYQNLGLLQTQGEMSELVLVRLPL